MVWVDEIGDAFMSITLQAPLPDGSTLEVSPEWDSPEGEGQEDAYAGTPKVVFSFERPELNLQNQKEQRRVRFQVGPDTVELRDAPIPYVLYFTVELITFWRDEDLALFGAWMRKFPSRGHLDVYSPTQDETFRLFREQVGYQHIREETRNAKSGRMYRHVFRYAIWTELDSSESSIFKMIEERVVHVREKE